MTREEAINEIKSWAIPSKNGREVLETLIPELRENEDENLKNKSGYYKAGKFWKASTLWNATKNKVPQRVPNRYILQECTWNIGTLQRFADEVKNVQEVSLDYPIILDMNGNIIDGAHRVVKAYLEGKDIDIVYIGDDEWPEPDYDEEKAVKESDDERIINQLITLVNINSAAGEVLLIPTNKEELVAWLNKCKESLHTQETCEENADSFADGIIEVRSFQRGMEEGRRLEKQKEQKQDEGDFTIYHPQKNGKGKYECIPFSFYGSLTSFSNNRDLMAFLNESFYPDNLKHNMTRTKLELNEIETLTHLVRAKAIEPGNFQGLYKGILSKLNKMFDEEYAERERKEE